MSWKGKAGTIVSPFQGFGVFPFRLGRIPGKSRDLYCAKCGSVERLAYRALTAGVYASDFLRVSSGGPLWL